VLSVHSTPRKRDAAFGALRKIRALTPDSMSRAAGKKLEDSVALAGSYTEQRLLALKTGVDRFRRAPRLPDVIRGPVSAARRALRSLPQMGEGGAHRMLLFAADHPVLPVDATFSRVAGRLGYGARLRDQSTSARSIRRAVAAELTNETEACRRTFLYLSHHGTATCTETDPHCVVCPLLDDCPHGLKVRGRGRLKIED
jgi:endonuclease-3